MSNILTINSCTNSKIKEILRLKEDYFFFEGEKLVNDIINTDKNIYCLLIEENFFNKITQLPPCLIIKSSKEIMKKVSSHKSPPKIIAIIKDFKIGFNIKQCRKIILLDNIQDPGNLGTIFRSAAAFDIDLIVLANNSVKLNNSKFIRAAQDSILKVPALRTNDIEDFIKNLPENFYIYNFSPHNKKESIKLSQVKSPSLLIFGSEGQGLSKYILNKNQTITIKQSKNIESLNLSVAVSIAMFSLYNNN